MSDLGRRLGFGGSRAISRESSASEQQKPEAASPTQEPSAERRSFTRRRPAEPREQLPSFDNHPSERSALLPSLLSRPLTSPFFDTKQQPYIGDAQKAAVQATAMATGGNDQAPLSPMSPLSTEPAGAQRPSRPRGLFKASSFLNLRGTNSFGSNGNDNGTTASKGKKGEDGDGRSGTPNLQSPRETSSALPWFEFSGIGRRVSSKASSNKSGGHERDRNRATDTGGQCSTPFPNTVPPLQPDISNASSYFTTAESSPKAAQRPAATAAPHDWKQWDPESDTRFSCLVNESDFTWHRPSFKQIVESLQVAIMSGETVPTIPKMTWPSQKSPLPPHLAPPSAPPSKRRPSLPALPSPRIISPEHPIPGRYRSHIMRAIEGIQDMQEALDTTRIQVEESHKAHERDLEQFAGLNKEWAAREQYFEAEIRRLQDSLTAGFPEQAQRQEGRREKLHGTRKVSGAEWEAFDGSAAISQAAPATFHDRVKKSIQSSPCTAKTTPPPPPPIERIDVYGKGRSQPALICDLEHDKLKSDEILRAVAKEKQNNYGHPQRHRQRLDSANMLSKRDDRSGIDQHTIDNIKKKYGLGESEVNGEKLRGGSSVGVNSKKKKKKKTATTTKSSKNGAGHSPTETEPSTRTQRERTKAVSTSNAQLESSSSSSSTSSSDEDLAMYESKTAKILPHSANGEDEVQDGGCRAPSPAEQTEGTAAGHNAQLYTEDILILPSSVDHETTTNMMERGIIKPQEEAGKANSHALDFCCESQQWHVERANSL